MQSLDWLTYLNMLISGVIAFIFGAIGSLLAYRVDKKRDDIAWEREKEKINLQMKHEIEMFEKQLQQKLDEIKREERERLVSEITKGIDNPSKALEDYLSISKFRLRKEEADDKKGDDNPEINKWLKVSYWVFWFWAQCLHPKM